MITPRPTHILTLYLMMYTKGRDDGFDVKAHTTVFTARPDEEGLFDDVVKPSLVSRLKQSVKKLIGA